MFPLFRTLSVRYFRRRMTRAFIIVLTIALGVATLVATRTLNDTMDRAVRAVTSPMAGNVDLMVTNGDGLVDSKVARKLTDIPGIDTVRPLLLRNITLPGLKGERERGALLVGFDWTRGPKNNRDQIEIDVWGTLAYRAMLSPIKSCVVGEELNEQLDAKYPDRSKPFEVHAPGRKSPFPVLRIGTVTAKGALASLGGNVVITGVDIACSILGIEKGMVSRLDIMLEPGFDRTRARQRVEELLREEGIKAEVTTPEELNSAVQKPMSGMQAGFTLCGLGALVVGMFLVYMVLSVSVVERRREIGILRSLGATRPQVRALFAGEAALLGLVGAALGVPLGLGLAYLALEPAKEVIGTIFKVMQANRVEWTVETVVIAAGAGIVTATLAALVPVFRASAEEPAVAVRRIPPNPTWTFRVLQMTLSAALALLGGGLILVRDYLPGRTGTHVGMMLIMVGVLVAMPLLAGVFARLVQPVARRLFAIEGRMAADNLVRAPARTGLVIAALAAGVALIFQTAGTMRSNRDSVRDWVENALVADLFVTAGSPISAGMPDQLMAAGLGDDIRKRCGPDVSAIIPVRTQKRPFGNTQVLVTVVDAREFYRVNRGHTPEVPGLDLYRTLASVPGTAIMSENFAALNGVEPGDSIELSGVKLRLVGKVVDYWWNSGTLILDEKSFARLYNESPTRGVNRYYVYLRPGADPEKTRSQISRAFGADQGLVVLTHAEMLREFSVMLERLYSIAISQQIVVGIVAALGVLTALVIAVLQRRREMGVLRAIGASRGQVIKSVLAEAALMGVIGTAIGVLVGIPLEWYILHFLILEESGFLFPVTIPWLEAGVIAGSALLIATLAGLGPALHAVRARIPEAIAHE
jgi:putative ABC transport system permease protein